MSPVSAKLAQEKQIFVSFDDILSDATAAEGVASIVNAVNKGLPRRWVYLDEVDAQWPLYKTMSK